MGLASFFGGKDDAISIYRKDLLAAVTDGDVERLRILLQKDIEAPPAVLDDVLTKTIKNNQPRMARMILEEGTGERTLGTSLLRSIVYDGKTELYRLLTDHGWQFGNYVPSENGGSYINQQKYMAKAYEADKLREELAAVRLELTALKKAKGMETGIETPAETALPAVTDDTPARRKLAP